MNSVLGKGCIKLCQIFRLIQLQKGGNAVSRFVKTDECQCQGPLACWCCGFESRQGNGCLSLVGIVCCYVQVSASGRSVVRRSPTDCGVSECQSGPVPLGSVAPRKKK